MQKTPVKMLYIIKSFRNRGYAPITLEDLRQRVCLMSGTSKITWENYKALIGEYGLLGEMPGGLLRFEWDNIFKLDDEISSLTRRKRVFYPEDRAFIGGGNPEPHNV